LTVLLFFLLISRLYDGRVSDLWRGFFHLVVANGRRFQHAAAVGQFLAGIAVRRRRCLSALDLLVVGLPAGVLGLASIVVRLLLCEYKIR